MSLFVYFAKVKYNEDGEVNVLRTSLIESNIIGK